MKFPRRQFLLLATATAALSRPAFAVDYPTKPARIIVGFAAGGAFDLTARLMGQWLSERLGRPFIVENRSGAGGNLGAESVVRAPADGYTLLLVGSPDAINATFYKKLNFNLIRDIAPVAGIIRVPSVMAVHPSFAAKTIAEFIDYARANPGKINMASAGNGSTPHVSGELFNMLAGVKMIHVPYRGGAPAVADLIGGQVQVMFIAMSASIEYIRAGKLQALAVTTTKRLDALPDIPTVSELLPGYEASGFQGIGAPKNTPAEVVDRLNKEINAGLNDPKVAARIADLGGTVLPGSPADFGMLISEETEKWAKVIKFAGVKAQ